MSRTIAALFALAGVALLLAWLTRGAGETEPPIDGAPSPLSARAPSTTRGPAVAKTAPVASAAPPAEPAADLGSAADPAAPPGASAASSPSQLEGLKALAKAAALARDRSEARETPPPVFAADRDGIRAAMRAAQQGLKDCYDPWVQLNPELQGRMTTSFVIAAAGGAVTGAHIKEGGLGSEALDGCVLSVLEGELRFEAPAGGGEVTVSYPLVFSSTAEADQPGEVD